MAEKPSGIAGGKFSITIALLALNDPGDPGTGSIKFAILPTKSVIEPPFKSIAVVLA